MATIKDRHLQASADETYKRLQKRPQTGVRSIDGRISVSLEFFPPQTDRAARQLWSSIEQLSPLAPDFVSVTYGAGGSNGCLTRRYWFQLPISPASVHRVKKSI